MARFQKFRRLSPQTVIGILLVVIFIETAALIQMSRDRHPASKTDRRRPGAVAQAPKPSKADAKKEKAWQQQVKLTPPKPPGIPLLPAGRKAGKIAIIIDDSGYNIRDCDHLRETAGPVTISILPNLEYSTKISECAAGAGKGVMLHLPMEAHHDEESYPRGYIIKTTMSAKDAVDRFHEALRSVPDAEGINNHTGSKATENQRLMSIIFTELKNNGLFFVDSRVTSKSVCPQLARKMRLPFAGRDVFLDNLNNRVYIEQQFRELAEKARKNGRAIGICHARELTWDILKEQIPKLQAEGFEIILAKDLVVR
ncbi:MAG: divergent polysaccharide deacetylase family protein [Candidatus Omnitrophota bacterium]|nr:divergent polysaccharide deacetylase family protein [Candidatus Omnitrophota bacterium]MDZ4243141.1 divergent polysaccharide deacetylase family protein [Candidatus Omnitrophota bacterium]